MTRQDAESIIAIAALAALADGPRSPHEHRELIEAAVRLGLEGAEAVVRDAAIGEPAMPQLAARLSTAEARMAAYEIAVVVCHADGAINPHEARFLRELASTLGIDAITAANADSAARAVDEDASGDAPTHRGAARALDEHIIEQATLCAALELLPDRLANLAILPLQLRLVRHIGQQQGQQLDGAQIRDLATALGIGAAAQVMESVVRRTLGGLAGRLLGGLLGSAAGAAAGGAVTFASTYALGHAAEQYYAQRRTLSMADLHALFARFQGDATMLFPRVQDRVAQRARGGTLPALLRR